MKKLPSLLTLAGFDPTGGAGILQDAAVFRNAGFNALAIPTVLVGEDSTQVFTKHPVAAEFIEVTARRLLSDFKIVGVKVGLLPEDLAALSVIGTFLQQLAAQAIPIVFDPVLANSAGDTLVGEAFLEAIKAKVMPYVTLVTPNADEYAALAPLPGSCQGVLITGVIEENNIVDHFSGSVGEQRFVSPLQTVEGETLDVHGSGCLFSSLITVNLALGTPLIEAIAGAKRQLDTLWPRCASPAESDRPFFPPRLDCCP